MVAGSRSAKNSDRLSGCARLPFVGLAEPGEEALRLPVGPRPQHRRGGRGAGRGLQLGQLCGRLGLRARHRAEHADPQRVGVRVEQQARGHRVRRGGRPVLPGGEQRGGVRGGEDQLERGRSRRGDRREDERGDDAEARATGPAQRPQELLVGVDDPPVGEHDLRRAQAVRGQPVQAAEDPEAAAEREAGDADGRAAAGRDRAPAGVERVVDRAQPRAGADRRALALDADRVQRRDVDDDALRGRAAREAVPAAANRQRQPCRAGEGERRGDVRRARAQDDRSRADVFEAGERRPPQRVVGGRAGPHDLTGDGLL